MTAKKKTTRLPKIEIEDSIAKEFANLPEEARANKVLITGFVAVLEIYDGNTKKLKVMKSQDLTDWAANGMIARAQGAYADDPEDDDTDYNPNWYWNQ
jgi:hypothetical protein